MGARLVTITPYAYQVRYAYGVEYWAARVEVNGRIVYTGEEHTTYSKALRIARAVARVQKEKYKGLWT